MNAKTRIKLQKRFGLGFTFNSKIKIPLTDVVFASYVMGSQNSEKFWNSILDATKPKKK
tara:strand:- start:24 stop:200 length:177 start_codon:yes stop_codon:yes gene_type:complete